MKKSIVAFARTFTVLAILSCLVILGIIAWCGWAELPRLLHGHILWSDAPLWTDLLVPTVVLSLFAWAFRYVEERSNDDYEWTFFGLGEYVWLLSIILGLIPFFVGSFISGPAWGAAVTCGTVVAVPIVRFVIVYSVKFVILPAWKFMVYTWGWMLGN